MRRAWNTLPLEAAVSEGDVFRFSYRLYALTIRQTFDARDPFAPVLMLWRE